MEQTSLDMRELPAQHMDIDRSKKTYGVCPRMNFLRIGTV